jgi:glucokinase
MHDKNILIRRILKAGEDLLEAQKLRLKDILGIGIGLPGLIDTERGIVHFLPNIPGWKNVPLRQIIKKKIRLPVFIDNDVNLMTLGEWKYGAGRGTKNLICVTLGTGVGGGLIIDNKIYRGEGSAAGEVGHIPLNEKGPRCNCGGVGCLERYVGNQYLLAKAKKIFRNRHLTLETVDTLAEQGDKRALRFWEETGTHIGNALVGVVNMFNPRKIVIGGGISKAHRRLFQAIEQTIKRRAMSVQASMVEVVKSKLGDNAAIMGTCVLVQNAPT